MENVNKIKKSVVILLVPLSVIMLYFGIITVTNFAAHGFILYPVLYPAQEGVPHNLFKNILYAMNIPIFLTLQVCAVMLLLSIKKDETPFNLKNVRLLKVIAILLMALEPLEVIAARIPVAMSDGTFTSMRYFPSGSMLVVGIVVLCVSLIFKYGISLQTQFDETL